MFGFDDQVPTTTSLLLQCGYRSKVCTNHRATKLDGTLHKLCEFHRRKANLNQQRLHQRQREKRARMEQREPAKDRLAKKTRSSLDRIAQSPTDSYSPNGVNYQAYTPRVYANALKLGSTDMDILELLLHDMQPQALPPLGTFLPSAEIDDKNSVAV